MSTLTAVIIAGLIGLMIMPFFMWAILWLIVAAMIWTILSFNPITLKYTPYNVFDLFHKR